MVDTWKLDEGLRRFEASLNQLEAAMAGLLAERARAENLGGEAATLREDRARLAEELDQVRAQASALAQANKDAAERVEAAMGRIRAVLGD